MPFTFSLILVLSGDVTFPSTRSGKVSPSFFTVRQEPPVETRSPICPEPPEVIRVASFRFTVSVLPSASSVTLLSNLPVMSKCCLSNAPAVSPRFKVVNPDRFVMVVVHNASGCACFMVTAASPVTLAASASVSLVPKPLTSAKLNASASAVFGTVIDTLVFSVSAFLLPPYTEAPSWAAVITTLVSSAPKPFPPP